MTMVINMKEILKNTFICLLAVIAIIGLCQMITSNISKSINEKTSISS